MTVSHVCSFGGYPDGASLMVADAAGESRRVISEIRLHCAGVQTEITLSALRTLSSPRLIRAD